MISVETIKSTRPLRIRLAISVLILAVLTSWAAAQEPTLVMRSQQVLVDQGYAIGRVDGIWGPKSSAALADLQRKLGLPVTGEPDEATLGALRVAPIQTAPESRAIEGPGAAEPTILAPIDAAPVEPLPTAEPTPENLSAKPPVVQNPTSDAATPASAHEPAHDQTSLTPQPQAKSDPVPFLTVLGLFTLIAAIGIYLFFRSREPRSPSELTDPSFHPPRGEQPANPSPEVKFRDMSPAHPPPQPAEPIEAADRTLTSGITPEPMVRRPVVEASGRPMARPPSSKAATWVPEGTVVVIGNHRLSRGLVYVGEQLPPQNGWNQRDNCLIVPSLPVANRADVSGQYLDYWPSYETISPSSRKAYLDWLASDRADPTTPIGYVFLYLYGLERRLILERSEADRGSIIAEVERLTGIYNSNRSFHRYSSDLLGAARLFETGYVEAEEPPLGLGDIPANIRIEIGRRAAEGKAISPRLLLAFVGNHPETRLKAPVRRLPHLVVQRFLSSVERDHPEGLIVGLPKRVPAVEIAYRAASSTFEVPIVLAKSAIPDLAQLTEPLGYGRALLEQISFDLDGYSREIGKNGGTPETIASLSKLPPDLRHRQAAVIAGDAMAALNAVADSKQLYRLTDLLGLVGLKTDVSTKIGLRDLGRCLENWGLGVVPDPNYAPKILSDRDTVLLFRLDMNQPISAEPSEHYQLTYLSLALGLVVAHADGQFTEGERRMLSRLIVDAPELVDQERRRLVADFRWLEANPMALGDLRQHLRASTPDFRATLMARLIPIAAVDGAMDVGEVAVLEKLAKILGLEASVVYDGLHRTNPVDPDDVPVVVPAGSPRGPAIPQQPSARPTVDPTRLAAIRAETAHASSILSEIFTEEVDSEPEPEPPPSTTTGELDQRHRALLEELVTRPQWSRSDFERLVRQAGLLPGGAMNKLNDWSLEIYDELVLEGDDPIVINSATLLESA